MKKPGRSDPQKKLKEKRKRMNLIDQKLLSLLNQRLRLALKLGEIKREMGKKIYDPGREKEVLEGLALKNKGPIKEEDLIKIFKTVIKVCREYQN